MLSSHLSSPPGSSAKCTSPFSGIPRKSAVLSEYYIPRRRMRKRSCDAIVSTAVSRWESSTHSIVSLQHAISHHVTFYHTLLHFEIMFGNLIYRSRLCLEKLTLLLSNFKFWSRFGIFRINFSGSTNNSGFISIQ